MIYIYIYKIKEEIGFVLDFKKTTDVIVNYLFMKGGPEESERYSENFLRILNRLNEISRSEISFNEYIDFERDMFFNDCFTRKIGTSILEIINKDFRWNLFFRIIFEIEEGNNCEDFEKFMIFIRYRFCENINMIFREKDFNKSQEEEIESCIMDNIAKNFCVEKDVEFLSNCNINGLNGKIKRKFKDIENYDIWIEEKARVIDMILQHKIS